MSRAAWTTAAVCSSGHHVQSQTSFSASSMQLPVVITNIKKYESGLSRILHHGLHWLDVTERIQFLVAATVYQCLHGMAPAYLTELYTPVTASASRRGGAELIMIMIIINSVRHNQQLGRTTLQTVNLRHPCIQCRWSSLLECLTGLFKVVRSFVRCF